MASVNQEDPGRGAPRVPTAEADGREPPAAPRTGSEAEGDEDVLASLRFGEDPGVVEETDEVGTRRER
jgi:hypothetical protein